MCVSHDINDHTLPILSLSHEFLINLRVLFFALGPPHLSLRHILALSLFLIHLPIRWATFLKYSPCFCKCLQRCIIVSLLIVLLTLEDGIKVRDASTTFTPKLLIN